jgi:hypothetical protein
MASGRLPSRFGCFGLIFLVSRVFGASRPIGQLRRCGGGRVGPVGGGLRAGLRVLAPFLNRVSCVARGLWWAFLLANHHLFTGVFWSFCCSCRFSWRSFYPSVLVVGFMVGTVRMAHSHQV